MTEIATQTVESDDPLLGVAESVSELDESQLLLLKQKVLAFTGQCVNSARSSIRLVYYSLALILCVAALATVYFNFQGHHYRTTLILLVLGPAMLLLLGYWKLLKMLTSLPDQVNDVVTRVLEMKSVYREKLPKVYELRKGVIGRAKLYWFLGRVLRDGIKLLKDGRDLPRSFFMLAILGNPIFWVSLTVCLLASYAFSALTLMAIGLHFVTGI
ncbi:MAG: hypothetical protein CMJ19_04650 [Phycisphaeraceae bacterium]|nr:hypothetical protein [Phycisphaeraceae bacterium]